MRQGQEEITHLDQEEITHLDREEITHLDQVGHRGLMEANQGPGGHPYRLSFPLTSSCHHFLSTRPCLSLPLPLQPVI